MGRFNTDREAMNAIFSKLRDAEKQRCCISPGDTAILTALEAICDKIENQTLENENNLQCSSAKACDADCNVVICHTCYDVEGTIVNISHTNPDGSEYTGDATTLELGCISCGEPIPTYEIINIPVCYEDCREGYSLIKVNTADDTVTPLDNYYSDHTVSASPIIPCPEIIVSESSKCITE